MSRQRITRPRGLRRWLILSVVLVTLASLVLYFKLSSRFGPWSDEARIAEWMDDALSPAIAGLEESKKRNGRYPSHLEVNDHVSGDLPSFVHENGRLDSFIYHASANGDSFWLGALFDYTWTTLITGRFKCAVLVYVTTQAGPAQTLPDERGWLSRFSLLGDYGRWAFWKD